MRKEIEAQYSRRILAFKKKDIRAYANTLHPSFTSLGRSGAKRETWSKKDVLVLVNNAIQNYEPANDQLTYNIRSIRVEERSATVVYSERHTRLGKDKKGRVRGWWTDFTARETWVKTSLGWKAKRQQELVTKTGRIGAPQSHP